MLWRIDDTAKVISVGHGRIFGENVTGTINKRLSLASSIEWSNAGIVVQELREIKLPRRAS
jgi:hypothetical protein